MSANEVKIILADEMRLYYDAFRENTGHPASEGKENSDYDGDFCEKLKSGKSGKSFIDFMNEITNNRHKEENKEKTPDKNKEDHDEDEDYEDDEELEKIINAITKGLGKLSEISESLDKKEGKKKNENKGN